MTLHSVLTRLAKLTGVGVAGARGGEAALPARMTVDEADALGIRGRVRVRVNGWDVTARERVMAYDATEGWAEVLRRYPDGFHMDPETGSLERRRLYGHVRAELRAEV